jgi:nitrogen fixation/metabolism regulation signal transduction histidine kinase
VRASDDAPSLVRESQRLSAPLFEYQEGRLVRSSDPLYDALRPVGLFIDPAAVDDLVLGYEDTHARRMNIGAVPTVFGHRVVGPDLILGTAARRNQLTLERQERDLLALLALAVALGALVALWLSGRTAQAFARPIGALRAAADEIASGARQLPSLGRSPPREFRPVYGAFRHMTTELSASEEELRAARRRTEAVLRDVASGVIAVDSSGQMLLANPSAERMLGVPLSAGVVLTAVPISAFVEPLSRFLQTERQDEAFDFTNRGREYRARFTRLSRGDGGVVITLDDVTDLLHAQRLFAWGEMARQVAHEIKNPLTPIRLGVQHVRRAHADNHADFAGILERNVARILQEIDRLDEIARSFAKFGTRPDDRIMGDPTDVGRVIRDVVELERLGVASVEWVADVPEGLWANARDSELREVLLNLFENARQASSQRVTVTAHRTEQHVIVTVADDGVGVPAELLTRVFEPRFSTRSSGSGLGLAICKRMVESWGGAIHLRPGSTEGTVVEVTLVAEPAP